MTKQTLRLALIDHGWTALDSRTDPNAYQDQGGTRYGTLVKNGVRLALSSGQLLGEERGEAIVYSADDHTDVILQALIVPSQSRRNGLANSALREITHLADKTGTSIHLEVAPIEDKSVAADVLQGLYLKHGFAMLKGAKRVMVRGVQK